MSSYKVIPCSGIGKVHGAIAREAAIETCKKSNGECELVCLAHLVSGDEDAKEKLKDVQCITIDGCPAMCAAVNVKLAGGEIKESVRVIDEMKKHRGIKPGTATYLEEDGWKVVDNIAENICNTLDLGRVEAK
ncbi:putative zinc-binding protein [Romboutsia sp.]|uniref:putative zinc-binding protein n=1 Tax=Romboutsia sp. TaxID=1965302 RepID=UPI003F3D66B7